MVTSESWPARNWPRPFVINGLSLISEPAVKICRTNSTIWKGWSVEKRLALQEEDSQPSFPWTRSIQPCSEFTPYSVVKRFQNRTVFRWWNRSNRFSFGCPQESSRSLVVNPLHPWNGKRLLLFRRGYVYSTRNEERECVLWTQVTSCLGRGSGWKFLSLTCK